MSSQKQQGISTQASEISEFYRGKSLFITGAAGFLGAVLLETLLRCCPGICKIYILLRSKKGVEPEDRKQAIFKKDIFFKLRETPEVFDKVVVVPGDITKENLGMKDDDLLKVIQEVSIVFHCAASISFHKPLNFLINQNVIGTNNVIEFCRKLVKLDVLLYTSTAYSNSHLKTVIDEKIYKLPVRIDEILEASRNNDEEDLKRLLSKCGPYPNHYTFSKSVTENLLAERASDLPVTIVRPSIIIACYKGALPGFIEPGSGIVCLCVGIGKGFIRVIRVDDEKKADQIPADVVANTHIIAAYKHVSESLPSPFIYNCVAGDRAVTWGEFKDTLFKLVIKHPLPNSFQRPSVTACKGLMKYRVLSAIEHYIPALVIDLILWIMGRKLRLYKLYQFYDKCMAGLEPFTMNEWSFKWDNFQSINRKLNTTDDEMFPVSDDDDFSLGKFANSLIDGSPIFKRNRDKPQENSRLTYLRYFMVSCIKWSVLGGIASIFYVAVF